MIKVVFKKSRSESFYEVLKLASKFDNFKINNKHYSIKIENKELVETTKILKRILSLAKDWKSFTIYVKDQNIINAWNFEDIHHCFSNYNSPGHCYKSGDEPGWSCRFLEYVERHIHKELHSSRKRWYEYGEFISEYVWKVDKDKIKSILLKEIEFRQIEVCPFFETKRIMEIIDNLPNEINTKGNNNFTKVMKPVDDGYNEKYIAVLKHISQTSYKVELMDICKN